MRKRILASIRRRRRRALAFFAAVVTGVTIALLTGAVPKLWDLVFPGDPVGITVEADPAVFDATMPVDWERYDYVIRQPVRALPAPPAGTCRERFKWARRIGGVDAYRSKFRVYLRGKEDEPVIIDGVNLVIGKRGKPAHGSVHVACPVGGAQPNPVMLYANLDRPSLRHGRIDDPARPFLLTLAKNEVETLEVQASTRRFDAEWWLDLKMKVGDDRRTMRIDDDGRAFRTTIPPRGSSTVAWDGGAWRLAPDLREKEGDELP